MEMDNTSTNTTSWSFPSTPWGQTPEKVLVVFIDQSAHAGTALKQATRFAHLNITHTSLKLDGVPTDKEIECDFDGGGDSTIAYNALFNVAFQNAQNASHGVSRTEFRERSTILPGTQRTYLEVKYRKITTLGYLSHLRCRHPPLMSTLHSSSDRRKGNLQSLLQGEC